MADPLTPEQRRKCMQANRPADTGPELRLRKALHRMGFRYVLHYNLPGRPDLAFPSRGVVVFVDGCFWHRCPLHGVLPKTDAAKWEEKLNKNVLRDKRNDSVLRKEGWKVVHIWEHDIRKNLESTATRVARILNERQGAFR